MPALGPVTCGIVGVAPGDVSGPVRADRFDRFQRIVGDLEAAPDGGYLAGHTACHALMNGVDRVVFVPVAAAADDDPDALAEAAVAAHRAAALHALVVPGLHEAAAARRVAAAHRAADSGGVLWLDAPPGADEAALLAYAEDASVDGADVRLVTPCVQTISPGRRRAERLPASCLVAPLGLGIAATLRGVHQLCARFPSDSARRLRHGGCDVLAAHGPRRLVGLAGPPPLRRPPPRGDRPETPVGLEAEIEAALDRALAPVALGATPDATLCRRLERNARAVLDGYRNAGRVVAYGLRCSLEEQPDGAVAPVMEVALRLPRRVREVVLRTVVSR